MKASNIQKIGIGVLKSVLWRLENSNDISSPTHQGDLEPDVYSIEDLKQHEADTIYDCGLTILETIRNLK